MGHHLLHVFAPQLLDSIAHSVPRTRLSAGVLYDHILIKLMQAVVKSSVKRVFLVSFKDGLVEAGLHPDDTGRST